MSDVPYIMETQDPRELWLVEGENKLKVSRDMYWLLASQGADLPPMHDISDLLAENAKLRKENDTLCHRIDELCMEVESLRRTAKRITVHNHDTDYATGHSECSECHGTVNPCARFCEHCGALFKEGE